ncbi:hypothetical protein HK103_000487 [Boothiomyces macroporosus]|uniref:Pentatricopeptide repeat-containing protein n=1 Tax=Boothiomyces macroporosus TaxID=261099 RepID=A0AAD5UCB7_9FUNG|nr:hypothetical protein HK103_000487 [Boothiomyces macroporosus]
MNSVNSVNRILSSLRITSSRSFATKINIKKEPKKAGDIPSNFQYSRMDGPRVNFNLKKIRQLNGEEKIELLRDYIKTKSYNEAVFVYQLVVKNGIANRLNYSHHHTLFHLLLKRAEEFKSTIQLIYEQLILYKFEPTENFLNDYLICLVKWGDVNQARQLMDQMQKDNLQIQIPVWSYLFKYYNRQVGLAVWKEGIELYEQFEKIIPKQRPDRATYISVMDLYKKLGNLENVYNVYLKADENVPRLYSMQVKRTGEKNPYWAEETKLQFFNCYLAAVNNLKPDNVLEVFDDMYQTGIFNFPIPSRQASFHIIFRYLSELPATTPEEQLSIINSTKKYYGYHKDCKLPLDYILYGRLISLQKEEKNIFEWYRLAITLLDLRPGTLKRQTVDSALVQTLFNIGSIEKALEAFQAQREYTRKPVKKVYFDFITYYTEKRDKEGLYMMAEYVKQDFEGDLSMKKYNSKDKMNLHLSTVGLQ